MKKLILSAATLALLAVPAYAENDIQTPEAAGNLPPIQQAPPAPTNISAPVAPTPVINCQYHIPAETTQIEETLITTWSEKAAAQSFDFNPSILDSQLEKLKACYTEQGWQGFEDALQKSGNLDAIKTQNLTVSSHADGVTKVNPIKENQWKVTIPMQVVYQNDKEKLTQLLTVDLIIGRKVSGDLGIMQIIATPRTPGAKPATPPTQPPVPQGEEAPAPVPEQ